VAHVTPDWTPLSRSKGQGQGRGHSVAAPLQAAQLVVRCPSSRQALRHLNHIRLLTN